MEQSNTTVYSYIYNYRYMGYMFRLSSHLQALKDYKSNYYKVVKCTVASPMLT